MKLKAESGASFAMTVVPDWLGGEFVWTNGCCAISQSGSVFMYSCNDACHCTGCTAAGYYAYEGFVLPVEQDVSPGKKIDFTIVYKGQFPSTNAEDIVVTTTFTENAPGATQEVSTAALTSVKVELTTVYEAPENPCLHRHVYGVGEKVKLRHFPSDAVLSWFLGEDDFFSDLLDGTTVHGGNH